MGNIKELIKRNIYIYTGGLWLKEIRSLYGNRKNYISMSYLLKKKKFIFNKFDVNENIVLRQSKAYSKILDRTKFQLNSGGFFIGIPETYYTIACSFYFEEYNLRWGNMTPDYSLFIENGIDFFVDIADKNKDEYYKALGITYDSIKRYLDRNLKLIQKNKDKYKDPNIYNSQVSLLSKTVYSGAENFLEALQMLFFVHNLCWIEGRTLVGFGSMDEYLYDYYLKDIQNGTLDDEKVIGYLKEFFVELSKEACFYSSVMYGDTGQVLVIGGEKTNKLTHLILEAFDGLKIVSPKIILKINSKTSEEVFMKSIDILKCGTGSPLYLNEEVVKESLIKYGYDKEDVKDFATAACWEPLIPGKSFDNNNSYNVNFMFPLEKVIYDENRLEKINSFEDFIANYKDEFAKYIKEVVDIVSSRKYLPAALFSSMYRNCLDTGKDVTQGGAKYNNYGFTSIGFSNVINALYSIDKFIFNDKIVDKNKISSILKDDFNQYEELKKAINESGKKFGQNHEETNNIAQDVSKFYYNELIKYKSNLGGCFKPGLGTASAYIDAKDTMASNMDGRVKGELISSNYSVQFGTVTDPINEINSLTKVDLTEMMNGSVMDLTFNYGVLTKNKDSIKALLQYFISKKGQSIQFNFLDYNTLLDAQKHPEKYSDLIVRVWGMSSYFTKLPEEYQNHIINRAMEGF